MSKGDAASGADSPPLKHEDLWRARRRLRCLIASALIRAMAETDTSIETIAARLGRKPAMLRRQLNSLISGMTMNHKLDWISDFAWAMGCEVVFDIGPAQGIEAQRHDASKQADGPTSGLDDTTNTGDAPCTP